MKGLVKEDKPMQILCKRCNDRFLRYACEKICPKCWDKSQIDRTKKLNSKVISQRTIDSHKKRLLLVNFGILHQREVNKLLR